MGKAFSAVEHRDPEASPRLHLPAVTIAEHENEDHHLLLWQVRGETDFSLRGEPFTLAVGRAMWVPAGLRHGFTTRVNSVLLPLFFPVEETATTLRELSVVAVDRDLRTLFLAQVQSTYTIIRPSVDITRQIFALIEDRPGRVADLPLPFSRAPVLVAEALLFNAGDTRSVAELAASAHTSARSLERAFLAETGMTLRRWRIANRMETAAVLLRSASTGTDAVAHRVGYTNPSAFRRRFKEHSGLTPRRYAERFRRIR